MKIDFNISTYFSKIIVLLLDFLQLSIDYFQFNLLDLTIFWWWIHVMDTQAEAISLPPKQCEIFDRHWKNVIAIGKQHQIICIDR